MKHEVARGMMTMKRAVFPQVFALFAVVLGEDDATRGNVKRPETRRHRLIPYNRKETDYVIALNARTVQASVGLLFLVVGGLYSG